VNNLAVLAQTSRVPFGRVSMFADSPGAFQFSPPKGSITLAVHRRKLQVLSLQGSSPRSTRDAVQLVSIARYIFTRHLHHHQTAKQIHLQTITPANHVSRKSRRPDFNFCAVQ